MAGHSKWAQIKRKKAVTDQKRAKIFSKLSKAITVSARLDKNLEMAIEAAKAVNMPKENIDRAIKKGLGEASSATQIEEVEYEAYGPNGIALIIQVLTDNRNRSVADLRATFNKHGGQIATTGSVKYLFDYLGVNEIETTLNDDQQLELISSGAQDIFEQDDNTVIYSAPQNTQTIKEILENQGKKVIGSSLQYIAKTPVEIKDEEKEKIIKVLEIIDDLEDVQEVFTNAQL